jgi:hypothetical protein
LGIARLMANNASHSLFSMVAFPVWSKIILHAVTIRFTTHSWLNSIWHPSHNSISAFSSMRYQRIDRVRKQQSHTFPIRDLRSLRGSMTTFPVVGESTFRYSPPNGCYSFSPSSKTLADFDVRGLRNGSTPGR